MAKTHTHSSAGSCDLLPCPFCGGRAEYRPNNLHGDNSMAQCQCCGAEAYWIKWNRRTGDAAQSVGMREALERIAIVCTQNMDRDKNHRIALDGVRQIANDCLDAAQPPSAPVEAPDFETALRRALDDLTVEDGKCNWAEVANILPRMRGELRAYTPPQRSSAGSDLAAKLKATHQQQLALWEAIAGGPEPRCRDCADFHGRCQGNGLPCDPQERALEQIKRLRAAEPQAPSGDIPESKRTETCK